MKSLRLFRLPPLLSLMSLLLVVAPQQVRGEGVAEMRAYCNVPPLPGFGVKPNLLIMLDNSASMYDPAYTNPETYCVDDALDTFVKSKETYLGYFEPGSFYRYVFSESNGIENGRFEPVGAGIFKASKCGVTDALTGSADVVAKVRENVCLNFSYDSLAKQYEVDTFIATGSFLNWLAMSKLDIEKKALTGGRFDTASGLLAGETRGCQGKRFIKMLGDAEVTFAVRGPTPTDPDYVYRASQGGMTRVEIYAKKYHKDSCLAAVTAWQDNWLLNLLKEKTDGCMGNSYDADGTASKGTIYSEAMADCYTYLAGNPRNPAYLKDDKLIADCGTRMSNVYNYDAQEIISNSGEAVCGGSIMHRLLKHDDGTSSSVGYLGVCLDAGTFSYDEGCVPGQMKDFCLEIETPTLTDPSAVATKVGTNANVPGFILDAGVYSLGPIAGTAIARLLPSAPPTGLIQEFSGEINFGAMIFNENGGGSEEGMIPRPWHCKDEQKECYQNSDCGSGVCLQAPLMDGSRVISYINRSPLGDHVAGSGLIAAIDAVSANSWTPLAESFYDAIGYFASRADLRLQTSDFDTSFPPSQYGCQRNNILMITDGISTADRAKAVNDLVANGAEGMPKSMTTTAAGGNPPFEGSYNLDDLAWIARNRNIADFSKPASLGRDFITTYVVYTGRPCQALNADGSFYETCSTTDEGVPEKLMELTALKGGGKLYRARQPKDLIAGMRSLLQLIGSGTNSTTDASILSTGRGNSALFVQEQFYRSKSFDGGSSSASWIGEMHGLWYYIDPFIAGDGAASAIREDTGGLKTLDLKRDRVVRFLFNSSGEETAATLYLDGNGDGAADPIQPTGYPRTVATEEVQKLWRAGLQLLKADPGKRTIYTNTDSGRTLIGLASNGTPLSYLDLSKYANQKLLQAGSESEAAAIVSFAQGREVAGGRGRVVTADGTTGTWKLGDIISSTAVVQSAVSLGTYQLAPPNGYGDRSYAGFIGTNSYTERGTAYVGANDGMLHAFRIGKLLQQPDGGDSWPATQKAALTGSGIGEESWAFVPKNALPYLRYLKEPHYPHLYYVDGSSILADVSIGDPATCPSSVYWDCAKDLAGSNWRTVLIGAMGLGGASSEPSDTCSEGSGGTCVKAPQQNLGLSSYFALDVTDQTSGGSTAPRLLWEFSPQGLGYATSGAAVIKINALTTDTPPTDDVGKNGRWFAVIASGPTGPIDPAQCSFGGKSGQNLKLFVVDINATPPFTEGFNYWVINTGIANAFGGSLLRGGIDADKANTSSPFYYEDDALYVGYSNRFANGTWGGGVLRLMTQGDPDPRHWKVSRVIDGVGPVTGGVAKLLDRKNKQLWLYFGTGRYFHHQDDLTARRALFAVKEPCYKEQTVGTSKGAFLYDDGSCSAAPVPLSELTDMTDGGAGKSSPGWWIALDRDGGGFGSERFLSQPSPLTSGAVFFTTYKPPVDVCLQGASYLWGVRYDTGGSMDAPILGTAIVPLSNGSSGEVKFSELTDRDKRRSHSMAGKPGGVKLITNSGLRPVKKIIHIQER